MGDGVNPVQCRQDVAELIGRGEKQNRTLYRKRDYMTARWYNRFGCFKTQSLTKAKAACHPKMVSAFTWLIRTRIGAINLAPELAKKGQLRPRWKNFCPFCRTNRPEDRYHLIFECNAWAELRTQHQVRNLIGRVRGMYNRLPNETRLPLLSS